MAGKIRARSRSTFRWFASSTSNRNPPRSTLSPGAGTFPDTVLSINAYLGGFPIAAALAEGADIVVTGRVVDSALIQCCSAFSNS